MNIICNPNLGLTVNETTISWKMNRREVRDLLKSAYEEDDSSFDVSDLFDGHDDDFDFTQNRDIYSDLANEGDLVFFNYDKNGALTDFEIHQNIAVLIDDFKFCDDQSIHEILDWFRLKQFTVTEVEPGNFAVAELKIAVATHESMGGDGDGLSYFYASDDISHLID